MALIQTTSNSYKTVKKMKLKLEAKDHEIVKVDKDVAFKSRLLQQTVEDLGITDADDERLNDTFQVAISDGKILKKIMEYCTKHRSSIYVPKGEREDPGIVLTRDDEEYLKVGDYELCGLVEGAFYLDIPGLLDIITQKIANFAANKSVEELREAFGIVNDLDPEEEKALREKFAWIDV